VVLFALLIVGCRATMKPIEDDLNGQQPEINNDPTPPPKINGDNISVSDEVSKDTFRAVWVASVLNLDFPSRRDLSVDALKREIDSIVSRTAVLGLNAVILQIRPTGDALYESDIFPWSHWLSGTQGEGIPGFDPLVYWIEACRDKDIELHAWLNPYRIIHTSTNSSDPNTLSTDNPVYINPDLAVGWSNPDGHKGLFLDPGLPEARQLILDGIAEIIIKYDVDGIHIDDYFYPGMDFNDSASFDRYGNGMELADWRRENVNALIRGIQTTIRELNVELGKNVRWGISPTAIWKNESSDPFGVPTTRGQETYHELYADTRKWVTEGWVDYICPQIYWYIGFERTDFKPIFDWWVDLCRDLEIDLYIGHAAYREQQDDQSPHWRGEIIRQLEMTENSDVVKGNVFYRFYSLKGSLGNDIRLFFKAADGIPERLPVMIMDALSVGMPERDTSVTASAGSSVGHTIIGTSIPDIPLFLNEKEVTNRTIEGFFSVFVPLEPGENEFTFTQDGQDDVTRIITRKTPGGGSGDTVPAVTVTQITTPRYATVNSDEAWLFPDNTSVGGSDQMLVLGQRDRVLAESSNNFVKLSCGMWVSRNTVSINNVTTLTENVLTNGIYHTSRDYDKLIWQSEVFPAVSAKFDGSVLILNFGMHTEVPPLELPADLSETVFSGYSSGVTNNIPFYRFTVRDDVKFEGYYALYEDGEFQFHLKKRKTLALGELPLAGITIMLDPGHGGDHPGALGPMGRELPEKQLNLTNSLKLADRLKELGAEVVLTRETDIELSLQARVNMAWQHKPDLFLSLHINSVTEITNAENIRGFTVWHRNPNSINLSLAILDIMHYINPDTTRQPILNQANFFVCRPTFTPAVLLEAGFIINIDDFAWLINPEHQDAMADATVQAILKYFSG